jgi:membrane-associated phospholipid phosphatase
MFQEINKNLLISLNSLLEYRFFEQITLVFVDSPIFFLPIFLIWAWIYSTYKIRSTNGFIEKNNLLFIFYGTVIAIIISLWIQQVVTLERPETVIEWIWKLILKHIPDASFPSDHATVSVAFLCWLFLAWYRRVAYCFLPFVILMNVSRIIVGVHWPLDIVAWTIVWILWSYITFKILSKSKLVKIWNQFIIKTLSYIKL